MFNESSALVCFTNNQRPSAQAVSLNSPAAGVGCTRFSLRRVVRRRLPIVRRRIDLSRGNQAARR